MAILRLSAAALLFLLATNVKDVRAQNNGDTICVDGYIMDRFCIDRGTLLDDSDVQTLWEPEKHSIHCLVDVGVCRRSPFHILEPKGAIYGEGWSVTDNDPLIDLARKVGSCSTCDGDGNQSRGFQAAVRGVVVDADKKELRIEEVAKTGTDLCSNKPPPGPTPSPTKPPPHDGSVGTIADVGDNGSPSSAFPLKLCEGDCDGDKDCAPGLICRQRRQEEDPVSIFCEGTPEEDNDYCVPANEDAVEVEDEDVDEDEDEDEDLQPTIVTGSNATMVDCSDYQHELEVPGLTDVTLQYVVNYHALEEADGAAMPKDGMMMMKDNVYGTMSVRIEYKGQGWIGFAVSPMGEMVGSDAVLGVPSSDEEDDDGSVRKYHLTFDGGASGYLLLDETQQTLMDASIVQDEDSTVLEFTKLLAEEGEIPINGTGSNYFLIAHGTDTNELGYHGPTGRATISLTLSPCMMMMLHKENATMAGGDMEEEEDMGGDEEDMMEEQGDTTNGQGPATVARTIANNEIEKPKPTNSGAETTMESNLGTPSSQSQGGEQDSSSNNEIYNQGNPEGEVNAGTIWAATTSGVTSSIMTGRYMFGLMSTLAAYFCL